MNTGQIKTALAVMANIDVADANILNWINAAYHEFERAYSWPFLDVLATPAIAIGGNPATPADMLHVKSFSIMSGTTLISRPKYISFREYEERIQELATPGVPMRYTLLNNAFLLLPVGSVAYTGRIVYRKTLADLALDADVPGIPTMYHYPLVEGAAGYALGAESEEERVNAHRQTFLDAIEEARGVFGELQEAEFGTVKNAQDY